MYYENYEDYMRNVLGYNNMDNCACDTYPQEVATYDTNYYYPTQMEQPSTKELEKCYPDIYKIVNPMVCKVCSQNVKPLTEETINEMVEEIYINVEGEIGIDLDVKVTTPIKEPRSGEVRNAMPMTTKQGESTPKETRQRNYLLNDLIRILILNQLLGGGRPPRPPYPGPGPIPPRPPYPGPGPIPPRPPYPGPGPIPPRPPYPGPGPIPPRPPMPGPGPKPPRPPMPGPGPMPPRPPMPGPGGPKPPIMPREYSSNIYYQNP